MESKSDCESKGASSSVERMADRLAGKFEKRGGAAALKNPALSGLLNAQASGDILRKLYPYFQSKIRVGLDAFFDRYADEFDPEEEEHKLVYMDIYKKYEKILEKHLEEFVDENGYDRGTFYDDLERAAANTRGNTDTLVKMLTAQGDFDFFVNMMKDRSRQRHESGQSESKSSKK